MSQNLAVLKINALLFHVFEGLKQLNISNTKKIIRNTFLILYKFFNLAMSKSPIDSVIYPHQNLLLI